MILIADSGSTKTTWCLTDDRNGSIYRQWQTAGINPFYQDQKSISELLEKECRADVSDPLDVYFYGAGCSNSVAISIVGEPLSHFFKPRKLLIESDLMAAARSLCQHKQGLACIMGTGSNSCFYDGKEITRHVPALGYILGDEGSAADIGRRLVADILKNQLPEAICNHFLQHYGLSREEILEQVYKNPFPNRFLAAFAPYVSENIGEESLYKLVKSGFDKFFKRNIAQYSEAQTNPVHFTGSIAWHFRQILATSATENGFILGKIVTDPMLGLVQYHSSSL